MLLRACDTRARESNRVMTLFRKTPQVISRLHSYVTILHQYPYNACGFAQEQVAMTNAKVKHETV